jgi:hypothetical protein
VQIINEAESGDTLALQAEISRLKEQLQAVTSSTAFAVTSSAASAPALPSAAATLLRVHARAALTLAPTSPSSSSSSSSLEDSGPIDQDGGAVAALVGRISQLELLLKQALEQHNASEKENVDLRALLHRCFCGMLAMYTMPITHCMSFTVCFNCKRLTSTRSLGSAVAEQATPQLYHSMVLQLKLRQVRQR